MPTISVADALTQAMAHHQSGRLRQAEEIYRRILRQYPDHPEALHMLGVLGYQAGHKQGLDLVRRALEVRPDYPEAWNNLGMLLTGENRLEEAAAALRRAVTLKPDMATAFANLAAALEKLGNTGESIEMLRRAADLAPENWSFRDRLGILLRRTGRTDEALECFRLGVKLQPESATAWDHLAFGLWGVGEFDRGMECCRKAMEMNPKDADIHVDLGLMLLLKAEWEAGWQQMEWRWEMPSYQLASKSFSGVRWDGHELHGERLMLHSEQGLGDTIHFARYVPMAKQRGGKIVLTVPAGLRRLIEANQDRLGVEEVVTLGERATYAMWAPLLSLPLLLGKTNILQSGVAHGYLQVNDAIRNEWRERSKGIEMDAGKNLRVGLAWRGRPTNVLDAVRSISLERFAGLARAGNGRVTFHSLQVGDGSEEAKRPPGGMELVDYSTLIRDFADTAAVVEQLDLVIGVDTAVAHLAGAMGKPTWVLLPFVPDYRWQLEGEWTPLYPTMRLIRQTQRGDWAGVMQRVEELLKEAVLAAGQDTARL